MKAFHKSLKTFTIAMMELFIGDRQNSKKTF